MASKNGKGWAYYRLNHLDNGKALRQKLKEGTGQSSVPYVFVDGKLLGGCDNVMAADYYGSQPGLLLNDGQVAADVDAPRRCAPLLLSVSLLSQFVFRSPVASRHSVPPAISYSHGCRRGQYAMLLPQMYIMHAGFPSLSSCSLPPQTIGKCACLLWCACFL
jgi:glutaredoxin